MRVVRAYIDSGWRIALEAKICRKYVHLVHSTPEGPKLVKIPKSEYRADEIDYRVPVAKSFYRRIARTRGVPNKNVRPYIRA